MMQLFRRGALLALVLPLLLVACTTSAAIRDAASTDVAAVQEDAARRAGFDAEIAALQDHPGAVEAFRAPLARPLDADAAVTVALLNNRSIRAAYERIGVARAELVQAGLFSNPVLSAGAEHFDAGTEIEGGIAQSVLDAFFIPLRKRVAETHLAGERVRLTRELVGLAFDVRRAHADVLAARSIIALRVDAVAIAEASQRLMQKLHAAGNVTGLDLAREDANVARARLDLHAAEMTERAAREDVNDLLGLWGTDTTWEIAEASEADAVDVQALVRGIESRAVRASLDLAADRADIESAAQRVGLLDWEGLLPDLDLGVAATREAEGEWGVGPEGHIELPLFDQGRARVAGAEAELRERLAHYEAHAVAVRGAARRLADRLLSLHEREVYLRTVHLTARARIVHETLLSYNGMQIGAFDVLLARRQEVDATREYLETRRALQAAQLDVDELLAGRLNPARVGDMHLPEAGGDDAPGQGAQEH